MSSFKSNKVFSSILGYLQQPIRRINNHVGAGAAAVVLAAAAAAACAAAAVHAAAAHAAAHANVL